MPTYWSATKLGIQKPGGIFWRMVQHPWIAATLPEMTAAFNAFIADIGVIAATQKLLTASLAGTMQPQGTLNSALKQLTANLNGAQTQLGTIATQFPNPLSATLAAQEIEAGVLGAAFPAKMSASVSGAQTQSGAISAAIAQLSAALNLTEQPQGVVAASLALATAAITGGQIQSGAVAVSLQKAAASLSAAEIESGSLSAALFQALAQLAGTSVAPPAPVFDAQATPFLSSSASTGSVTWTLGTNATAYVVFSTNSNRTVSSVKTSGGTNLILVSSQYNNNSANNGGLYCYKLTGAAAGSVTITVTLSSTTKLSIMGFSFTGIDHEIAYSTQYASASTMSVAGSSAMRASMVGLALFAAFTGTMTTPTGGTNLTAAQQASGGGGCVGAYSGTNGTTFGFGTSSTTNLAGMFLELDALADPTTKYAAPGTYTQTVPASGTVDLVGIGAGGGGSGGATWNGYGGAAGSWGTATSLTIGTNILAGSTITITVGTHGNGSPSGTLQAGNGGATTITYYDMTNTLQTVTCAGGAGGNGQDSSGAVPGAAPSPTRQTINGVNYQAATAGGASGSGVGPTPGAGGGGSTTSSAGGNGGDGTGWVTIQ